MKLPGTHSTSRRSAMLASVRMAGAAASAAVLAACGFELRRAPALKFATVQLVGFRPGSELAGILRKEIAATESTRVVESRAQAQVVLEAFTDASERVVVASTAAGQVREMQLRQRLVFRLRNVFDDAELIPRTELLLKRDVSYNESDALAKEQEQAFLFRALQADIVGQLMRQLNAVKLP